MHFGITHPSFFVTILKLKLSSSIATFFYSLEPVTCNFFYMCLRLLACNVFLYQCSLGFLTCNLSKKYPLDSWPATSLGMGFLICNLYVNIPFDSSPATSLISWTPPTCHRLPYVGILPSSGATTLHLEIHPLQRLNLREASSLWSQVY